MKYYELFFNTLIYGYKMSERDNLGSTYILICFYTWYSDIFMAKTIKHDYR